MLSTTKVYIDSRCVTTKNGSSIEYEIPGGVDLKLTTRVWLSEFTCVAAWHTLDATTNTLFLLEGDFHRALELPQGVYDLESFRAAIETVLNSANKAATMGTYTVTLVTSGSGGGTMRILRVSCSSGVFAIPDDATSSARLEG